MKLTYLFGAGASAYVIPPYRSIKGEMNFFSIFKEFVDLENEILKTSLFIDDKKIKKLFKWANEILDESYKFSTVDTYAKFLYIKNDPKIDILKKVLACLFYYIESFKNKKIDHRYLPFLVSLFEKDYTFPENVQMLTWNYDSQMLFALNQINHNLTNNSVSERNDFKIPYFQLNGCATILTKGNNSFSDHISLTRRETLDELAEQFIYIAFDSKIQMNFAWENPVDSTFIQEAKKRINKSDILVIIGYSFPFFNRYIDKELIREFSREAKENSKIYIQDPVLDEQTFKSQFEIPPHVKIEIRRNIKSFLIPHEL